MTPAVEIVPGADRDRHKAPMIPGSREPGMLATLGALAGNVWIIPDGPSTMDAATIAERQREGGGAPSQRRPARERSLWKGLGRRLHQLLTTARALSVWRFRTNHVSRYVLREVRRRPSRLDEQPVVDSQRS